MSWKEQLDRLCCHRKIHSGRFYKTPGLFHPGRFHCCISQAHDFHLNSNGLRQSVKDIMYPEQWLSERAFDFFFCFPSNLSCYMYGCQMANLFSSLCSFSYNPSTSPLILLFSSQHRIQRLTNTFMLPQTSSFLFTYSEIVFFFIMFIFIQSIHLPLGLTLFSTSSYSAFN